VKILLTNDDGIDALGLQSLREYLTQIGHDVFVVAPDRERSCCGHGMSLGQEVLIKKVEKNVYICDGLPADCSHLGIREIFSEFKLDLVISGINHGANLGQDIYYSGTLAGAREASFLGIPSLALSICDSLPSEIGVANIFPILNEDFFKEIKSQFQVGNVVNVNYPHFSTPQELQVWKCDLAFRYYCNSIKLQSSDENSSTYKIKGSLSGHKKSARVTDSFAIENGHIARSLIKVF